MNATAIGEIYITVQHDGHVTRVTACSTEYAHALATALTDLGYPASHVPSVTTRATPIRDCAELDRVNMLLTRLLREKGGLSIIDLQS